MKKSLIRRSEESGCGCRWLVFVEELLVD